MKKSFALLFSPSFIIALILLSGAATVSAASTLFGWAWSDNIGWISFSSNTDGSATTYGVTVDSSGNMAGYAWSDDIGWISFNASDTTGCPVVPAKGCAPQVDLTGGGVTGWARAIDEVGRSDGWDGWIELSGTNHASPTTNGTGGVTYIPASALFNGWAWGGEGAGWINFGAVTNSGAAGPGLTFVGGSPNTHALILQINTQSGSTGTVVDNQSTHIINCTSSCSGNYANNTAVIFTETPGASTVFTGWGGGCSGTGTTCSLTMSTDQSISASYSPSTPASTPTVTGTARVTVGNTYTYTASSTDPNAFALYYNIIINQGSTPAASSTPNFRVPASSTVASGVGQTFSEKWTSAGVQTIWAQAVNTVGTKTSWGSLQINALPSSSSFREF